MALANEFEIKRDLLGGAFSAIMAPVVSSLLAGIAFSFSLLFWLA